LVRIEVGDRDHLGVGVLLVAELRAEGADPFAHDGDAHAALGERLPDRAGVRAGVGLLESLDVWFHGSVVEWFGGRNGRMSL